ncbi:MAG: carbonic anhydrase [Parachlamydiaceae bacterium]|nr:carbonic anhydrase [Parachlamydiaceae bacterium]
MKLFTKLTVTLSLATIAVIGTSFAEDAATIKTAFNKLVEGNQRYVNSSTVCHDDWSAKRLAQSQGQAPFAVIVTCSDSRVPPEIIFDQALGDLFVIRVAGNVVDDFAIGSIEYGVTVLGADLILVLGHSNCGAVDGALKGLKFDNHIQEVLNAIQPAVDTVKGASGNVLEKAIKANVVHVESKLKGSKPVLAKLLEQGKVSIVGAYYDLATGKVEFLDQP